MRLVTCLADDHDPWLVGLAALICAFGAWVTVRLHLRARAHTGEQRAAWVFLGAVAAGSTVWCTHFVAMLAFRPGATVSYEPKLTALSLAVAILAGAAGLALASARSRFAPGAGGAVLGGGIAAMHYTGMAAFAADGLVLWDARYAAASVLCAVGLAAWAFARAARPTAGWRGHDAAGLLVLAIVGLHFTGMAAITVLPSPAAAGGAQAVDAAREALAIAAAGVGLLVLGTGAASHLLDRQGRDQAAARLRHLAESAVDGMVIERDGRVLEVNAAFEALAGAPRDRLLGVPFAAHVEHADELRGGALARTSLRAAGGPPVPVEVVARMERGRAGEPGLMVYAVRDLRPRLAQERRIAHLAFHDSLTGLPNRAAFLDHLERAVAGRGPDGKVSLLAIDLDRFKEVNDLHGHAAGDRVLRVLAGRMRGALREGEFLARLGGDEFVAVAAAADRGGALDLASRLEAQLSLPVPVGDAEPVCGGSIGIAVCPDDAETGAALMNNADLAMYRAKGLPAQAVCFYEGGMDEATRARRRTVGELREALAKGQFEPRYQVQVAVATGEVTGYEVLLRWKHPERGYVPPSEFIPLAEETGLILPIGEWILRTACAEAARWRAPHKIAVNLSAVQLAQGELPRVVGRALADAGLPPSRLELEITETSLVSDPERATRVLREIKALGVSVAMDDFGSGHSSLATLRALAFDKIKLDKSFMGELDRSPQARAIIRAVLALGGGLGIPVLAEGVETAGQLAFLREQGCDEAQGYLLGRPAPSVEEREARPEALAPAL